ncbi:MAG: META domain-containing protein [Verrucomicrobiota bacterium]
MRLLILTSILLATVSCSQEDPPIPTPPPQAAPAPSAVIIPDGSYTLKTMNSSPYQGPPVTITVDGGKISGKAPVNNFHATLIKGTIGPVASTMMAGEPEAMKLESELFQLLEGSELNLTADQRLAARKKGIALLMFSPVVIK